MERKLKSLTLGMGGALLMLGTTLLAPLAAHAGADGRKNTAIALGAAAAYELLLKHQTGAGLVLGAGAAYAGKRYEDARRSERDQNNRYYYRNGYPYGSNNNNNGSNNNGYYDNNGNYHNSYNNNGYDNSYDNNGYGNNGYKNNQDYQRQGRRHDNSNDNRSQGDEHGNKRGWNGRDLPPGQLKHRHHDNDDN